MHIPKIWRPDSDLFKQNRRLIFFDSNRETLQVTQDPEVKPRAPLNGCAAHVQQAHFAAVPFPGSGTAPKLGAQGASKSSIVGAIVRHLFELAP